MPGLTEMLGADVSELILCLDEVDADSALLNQLLDKKEPQGRVFYLRAVGPVAVKMLLMYSGTLLNSVPNSSIFILFENNTDSLALRPATSSASTVDCAVSLCRLTLELTEASKA